MTHDSPTNSSVPGNEVNGDVVLAMTQLKSFVVFDEWMDDQLAQLVSRWIHTAAPNANRPEPVHSRIGHNLTADDH